jgi:hypothetical protein
MEGIEAELEACRTESAQLSRLIQDRNGIYLEREQALSNQIAGVASRIRILESSAPVSVEDIKSSGGDAARRLANLAERAAEYAVRLRSKRQDEALAATAIGRLNDHLIKLEGAITVPDQLVRSNHRGIVKLRDNIISRARDFAADLSLDESQLKRELLGGSGTTSNSGDSLRRSAHVFGEVVNHVLSAALPQSAAFGKEYIMSLESDIRKMRFDSQGTSTSATE